MSNRCGQQNEFGDHCLRHWKHKGPHYFAPQSLQKNDPVLWQAFKDYRTVLFFRDEAILPTNPSDPHPQGAMLALRTINTAEKAAVWNHANNYAIENLIYLIRKISSRYIPPESQPSERSIAISGSFEETP